MKCKEFSSMKSHSLCEDSHFLSQMSFTSLLLLIIETIYKLQCKLLESVNRPKPVNICVTESCAA